MNARPADMHEAQGGTAGVSSRRPRWNSFGPARRAVLWSFLDQAIVSGFGFATGIATGRLVGISEFGRFAIVMVFVALAWAIHHAIFATPMMTLAGHRSRSRAYFDAVLISGSIGGVLLGVAGGVLFGAYYLLRSESVSLLMIVATGLLVAIQCILLILRRMLFVRERGRMAVAMDLTRYGLFVAIVVALLALEGKGVDTTQIVLALGVSGIVAALAFLPTLGVPVGRARAGLMLVVASQHWRIARWFIAIVFVSFAQEQLLLLLAGFALGDAPIGGMRAALYLFGPILVLMSAMENIMPVRAAAAYGRGGVAGLNDFLLRFGSALVLANGAFILVAVLPGEIWLHLLFGEAYADYAILLPYLGGAAAFTLIRDVLAQYFRALRASNTIFYSYVAGFALAVVLIYPLVAWFGVVGLAIDTLACQFASTVYMVVAVARHRQTTNAAQRLGPGPVAAR